VQSNSFIARAWEMQVSNDDQKGLIRAKMVVSIKKKKKIKLVNFKVAKNM
jgi:hypothetical protein